MSDSEGDEKVGVIRDVVVGGVGGAVATGIGSGVSSALTPQMMEALLTEWYESTVKAKVLLNGKNYQNLRAENNLHVMCPLYDVLQKAYKFRQYCVHGIVYVVCAKAGQGKTHAASYLVDRIASKKGQRRGLMVRGGKSRQKAFDLAVGEVLGVPPSCRFQYDWIEKLLMALSGKEHETITNNAFSNGEACLDMVTEMVCPPGASTIETPRTKELPPNETGQYQPILIFDDWNTAIDEEKKFIKELAQEAHRKRVMVVILTDHKTVAWELCQQNGLERIQPLPRSFVKSADPLKVGDQIDWLSLDWDKKQLTELVSLYHDFTNVTPSPFDDDGSLTFVADGMTPRKALEDAAQYMALSLPSNVSSTSTA